MPAENKNSAQIMQKIEWKEEQFPSIYSNVVSVGVTPFDIFILLGEVESATPSSVKAKVIVSPEQASILMQTIQQALAKFVEGNGPLRPAGKQQLDAANFKFESPA